MKDLVILYRTDLEGFASKLLEELNYINNLHNCLKNLDDYISLLATTIYYDSFENGINGYIYCMYNDSFKLYGTNVYKLGCTNDLKHRLSVYATGYVIRPIYKAESKILNNYMFAEKILFELLASYRMYSKREFFDCPLNVVKDTFVQIEQMFEVKQNRIMMDGVHNGIKKDIICELRKYVAKNNIQHGLNGLFKIKKQCEIAMDIKKEDIDMLMDVQNDTDCYENINKKPIKTIRDKYTMDACVIKKTFNVINISREFLQDLNHGANIDKYYKSLIYFSTDTYKDKYMDKCSYTESKEQVDLPIKQADIIRNAVKLFWKNGLLSKKTIKAFSSKEKEGNDTDKFMTDNQKKFLKDNIVAMRQLFESVKRREKPVTQYQFIKWLDAMIGEFFGPFVKLDVSDKKFCRVDGNRYWYYEIQIDIKKYLELILLKNKVIIDKKHIDIIKNRYGDTLCSYKDMHKFTKILDMCYDEFYGFIDEETE